MTTEASVLAENLGFTEGPVALGDGSVAVTSITHAVVYRLEPDGKKQVLRTGGGPNGLAVGADGAFYVAQNGGRFGGAPGTAPGIQRMAGEDLQHMVMLDADAGPNDLCFGPDGWLYFTDSHGDWDGAGRGPIGRLYACQQDGSDLRMLHEGLEFINGLAFHPDGGHLFVVETAKARIWSFPWEPGPSLGTPVPVFQLTSGSPDGIAFDRTGYLWVAATTDAAVQVIDPNGQVVARHPTGAGSIPTNLCFGQTNPGELYVTDGGLGRVLRFTTGVEGAPLYGRP